MRNARFAMAAAAMLAAGPALAYVGPGAGLSVLGALWGLLIAIAAAIAFVVAWPVRRYLRRRRERLQGAAGPDSGSPR